MLRTQLSVARLTLVNRLQLLRNGFLPKSAVQTISSVASSNRTDREKLNYDVLIVGGGPAGLSAAIKLKQRAVEFNKDFSVCVIEKGSEVGAHALSGGVLDTRALDELFPDWKDDPTCPVKQPVSRDRFEMLLGARYALRLPAAGPLSNAPKSKKNYVISLSEVTRWMAARAEALGVDVLPGFPGAEVLYDWDNRVIGVATADGANGPSSPGTEIHARATLFAEGCRGFLSESVIRRFNLRKNADPQTYALGIKEVWDVPASLHKPGFVMHTVGWPLDLGAGSGAGGGFLYHLPVDKPSSGDGLDGSSSGNGEGGNADADAVADKGSKAAEVEGRHRVALGLVISLDYKNPHLDTFEEFERWRSHPSIQKHIAGGTRLQYGARSLNEGGFQAIPELAFPGGALVGCAAGFLDAARMKGMHGAMLSGMAAAEACVREMRDLDKKAEKERDEKLRLEVEAEAVRKALEERKEGQSAGVEKGDEKRDEPAAAAGESKREEEEKKEEEIVRSTAPLNLASYPRAMSNTWVWDDLQRARNVRPGFRFGLIPGLVHAAVDQILLRGKAPWTLVNRRPDHESLRPAAESAPIDYSANAASEGGSKAARLSARLFLSGTNHPHGQPSHLVVDAVDAGAPVRVNLGHFDGPEVRYCPAGVYEYVYDQDTTSGGQSSSTHSTSSSAAASSLSASASLSSPSSASSGGSSSVCETGSNGRPRLVVHAQNCLHCKACDIKDPTQNIKWTPPPRGGPQYTDM